MKKNILAENLLRFGAKNLSEAEIQKLHEQDQTSADANIQTSSSNSLEELKNKWVGQKITNNMSLGGNPSEPIGRPFAVFNVSGPNNDFVEFLIEFSKPIMTVYKQRITKAKYKYNPTKNVSINSAGDLQPGAIPYTWNWFDNVASAKYGEWSQSEYGTPIEQMEIPKNSPFLRDLKFYLSQTVKPTTPPAK